jgi:hypothetical protein
MSRRPIWGDKGSRFEERGKATNSKAEHPIGFIVEKIMEKKTQTRKDRIEALEDIKLRGLYLGGYAITADAAPIVFDTLEYQQLVDQFYEENKDLVTAVIHRACRENYEFFMTIVEQAISHFRETEES